MGAVNDELILRPVLIFIGPGNWRFWRKSYGASIALTLRRLGYLVVVPDLTNYPEGNCDDSVSDLRHVTEWTYNHSSTYGGDLKQIYIMGFGSGAHITLLTLIQEAVVKSRDEYLSTYISSPSSSFPSSLEKPLEISAGIRKVTISRTQGEFEEDGIESLPRLAGIILISGAFDIIKQLRWETGLGIDDVSALKRSCGLNTGTILLNCPSQLLYASKQFLNPNDLPRKILIIAGGKDSQIPYSQSVLIRNLLLGIGLEEVRLRLYKEESHWGSLTSLMHRTRYSNLILGEIDSLISG